MITIVHMDNYPVHIVVAHDAMPQNELDEARSKYVDLGKRYRGRIDGPHDPKTGQVHIHVYAGKTQIFAMNVDGTAHDRSHDYQIPSVVAKEMARTLQQFRLPPNNYIEWLDEETTQLLLG